MTPTQIDGASLSTTSGDSSEDSRLHDSGTSLNQRGVNAMSNSSTTTIDLDQVQRQLADVCLTLKLGNSVEKSAMHFFQIVWRHYTLEGSASQWIVCSIYTAYYLLRSSETDLHDLTMIDLLNECHVNLLEFFDRVKRWVAMLPNNGRIEEKVRRVEANFGVSAALFKKYDVIMNDIFNLDTTRGSKNSKQSSSSKNDDSQAVPRSSTRLQTTPTKSVSTLSPKAKRRKQSGSSSSYFMRTASDCFKFCWKWFVYVKSSFDVNDDLVGSFHLLLGCIDYFCVDLYSHGYKDLISEEYQSLLIDSSEIEEYASPSILSLLCSKYSAVPIEAKRIRSYWLRPKLKLMHQKELLFASDTDKIGDPIGIVTDVCWNRNMNIVETGYKRVLVESGQVDETIFLSTEDWAARIGSPRKGAAFGGESEFLLKKSVQACLERVSHQPPSTPLSGRQYLSNNTNNPTSTGPTIHTSNALSTAESFSPVTPISTATQSLEKLLAMLADCPVGPSTELAAMFELCDPTIKLEVEGRVDTLSKEFTEFCMKNLENLNDGTHPPELFASQGITLVRILYYRVLTRILQQEVTRHSAVDVTALFKQDILQRSLFACCLEIVMFSYNSQWTFPAVLELHDIPPFHFYKVIELIIRAETGLCRDVVKHLSMVEERILEELAWTTESPLWAALQSSGERPPAYADVAPVRSDNGFPVKATSIQLPGKKGDIPQTPMGVSGRFLGTPEKPSATMSAAASAALNAAKRKLSFIADANKGSSSSSNDGQPSNLPPTSHALGSVKIIKTLPITLSGSDVKIKMVSSPVILKPSIDPVKPQKKGSVALFFRKVYSLTFVRLRDICERLNLSELFQQQTWTFIEKLLRETPEMFRDRHLDQIIISSVYIMAKVTQNTSSFQEILYAYRNQPQCRSRVYRNVLLERRPIGVFGTSGATNMSHPSAANPGGIGSNNANASSQPSTTDDNASLHDDAASDSTVSSMTLPPPSMGSEDSIGSSGTMAVDGAHNHQHHNMPSATTTSTGTGVSASGNPSGHQQPQKLRSSSTMPVPALTSAPPTPSPVEEERGDLIRFYNSVFVRRVESLARDFAPDDVANGNGDGKTVGAAPSDRVPLSPFPVSGGATGRSCAVSPRKKVANSVYVSPMKPNVNGSISARPMQYNFCRSPYRDLAAINSMIKENAVKRSGVSVATRCITYDDDTHTASA